jgi:hypothetical protein
MVVVGNFRNRAELRKKKRRHFHYNAKIVVDAKGTLLSCSIIDISEHGARLVLENDREPPEHFVLLLTASGDTRRHCRVVWRNGTTVGVAFTDVVQ